MLRLPPTTWSGEDSEMRHVVTDIARLKESPSTTSDATSLVLGVASEPPEMTDADRDRGRFSLQGWMDAFPHLESLTIRGHVFPEELRHPKVRDLRLEGGIALTPLRCPNLERLVLRVGGDADGVAQDTAAFHWLAEGDRFEKLESLDLRGVDVEPQTTKNVTFISLLAASTTLSSLRHLAWSEPEETSPSMLRKHKEAFGHLETFVISDNRSSYEKPPLRGCNVIYEAEISHEVPLEDVPAHLAALPQPAAVKPALSDDELESVLKELLAVKQRFSTATLSKMIGAFAKARQWNRVQRLLEFAKVKAPHRRAFMDVREDVEEKVAKALSKKNDAEGQALLDVLEEANRL